MRIAMRAPRFTASAVLSICAALAGQALLANDSLTLLPGVSATVQTPAVPPFTTLGDTRLELRIHNWRTPAANATIFRNAGFTIQLKTNGELCASDNIDALPEYGGTMCADITGKSDVTVRAQRDTSHKQLQYEVHSTAGDWTASAYCGTKQNGNTYLNTFPCPIATVNLSSWAGAGGLGDGNSNARLAWIKWFSGVVPGGSAGLGEATPADLADWRFEGSPANQGTGGYAVALGPLQFAPVAGASGVGGVLYMPSPVFPPACSAGPQQTFRAGFPAQLDGSGSSPLDGGGGLTYSWEQVSGPSTVAWSGRASARPIVTGLVFGSYVLKLTVTGASGLSAACAVKHGAVASDDNGVVITNNSAVDTLLGPMIRFGANPWPWFDDRHKAAADAQIANLDPYYGPYWDTAGPGTITASAGSATITGAGTSFTTTFCQGPANPTQPKSGAAIVVWYPTGAAGQTGRRQWWVSSCQGDTQLTINAPWKDDVAGGSGLQYSYSDYNVSGIWSYGPAPANYYDNVAGLYALYYRSGIDDYLNAARKLADRFWTSPQVDRGAACVLDGPGNCFPARSQSTMGLVLRALDGRPDMWSGFHKLWDTFMGYYLNWVDVTWGPGMWDLREEAYHLAMVSYCALYDTDPTYRANCKASVGNSFARLWTPYKAADGSWPQFYAGSASWDSGSSATLASGSRDVIGNGTNWTAGQFGGYPIWFTSAPGSRPADNSGGDRAYYTPTFVDATHIRLDRPYEGASGVHGWALASGATAGLLGWGSQPFMMGILSAAFDLAARAIADSDPANSALAHNYNVAAANWIRNYGYWPLRKGLYYGAQYVNCQAPIADSNGFCTANNSMGDARVLNAEALRGVMTAYAYSGDPALKTFADTLYSAMFSKPGTGGPNPDGYYIDSLNDGTGWYMIGAPPTGKAPKYFGMFFGFSSLSAWPAYRAGGLQAAAGSTGSVTTRLGRLPGVSRVRIAAVAPSGAVETTECRSARCSIGIDQRQGTYLVRMEYLSESGAIVATDDAFLGR